MNKEVKITPPEGYEIDKENSTFDCIKFKKVNKRWRYDKNAIMDGFYIVSSNSTLCDVHCANTPLNYNTFLTEKHGKSALAMARISQIMANDKRFGGAITDKEWNDFTMTKYTIYRNGNEIDKSYYGTAYCFLAFHTAEQRDLFWKENKDLVNDYFML